VLRSFSLLFIGLCLRCCRHDELKFALNCADKERSSDDNVESGSWPQLSGNRN